MIVGIIGILKAGGAYVPIEPNSPTQRIAFILNDTQLQFLLTQTPFVSQLPDFIQDRIVCLDQIREQASGSQNDSAFAFRDPNGLAYIIYTDSFMLTNVNNSTLFKYKLKREGETKWRRSRLSTKNLRKISEIALYNLNWLGSRQLRKRL
jgi:acyl-CoA synthetase (AMP-forming)/AMP-acid ligase II